MDTQKKYPLNGVKVLDLTQVVSGPCASMMLADYGAEVVKVEPPNGETYRHVGKLVETENGKTTENFLRFSRNKKSITVNLKEKKGQEIFKELIPNFDVLLVNFRPGVMENFGLDWNTLREINNRLIYATISGFGDPSVLPSPYSRRPAFAIIAESMGGLMNLVGEKDGPPLWLGFALSDMYSGSLALSGVLMALYERENTGKGRRVDVSMNDAAIMMNDLSVTRYGLFKETMSRGQYSLQAPWGAFPTKDGYVCIALLGDKQWHNFCKALNRSDLEINSKLSTGELRSDNFDEYLKPVIEDWTKSKTKDEVTNYLLEHDVPAAPVNEAKDLFNNPHVKAHKMLVEVEDKIAGKYTNVGIPIKMDGLIEPEVNSPPTLGEHSNEIFTNLLGLSDQEISDLREKKII
jgi:CoA:oxalate CoA-transferase